MPPFECSQSGGCGGSAPCDPQAQQPLSGRSENSKQEELASLASRDAFAQMKRTSMASRMFVESIKEEDTGLRADSRLSHPLDARSYSPALKEVVELITIGQEMPAPVGSYRYLAFKYWGDIDVFEKVYLDSPSEVTARIFTRHLQRVIINVLNLQATTATSESAHSSDSLVRGVYFLELKCGLHPNASLTSITGLGKWDYAGRKLVDYDGPRVYRQLSRLLAEGLLNEHVLRKAPCLDSRHSVEAQWSTTYKHWILSIGEAQSPSRLTSRVSSGGAAQRDRAMTEYEFFRQWVHSFPKLRWSPKEIIAGRKVVSNSDGLSMTLEDAVRSSRGEVKLDVAVSLPQGRIIEASVLWQVESDEGLLTKPLDPYKESLNSDILKYAGGNKQDFYKTAKRMWSREVYNYYQHLYNDTKRTESLNVLWTLAKLFSSPPAAVARCITDLRTIDHALESRWRTRLILLIREPLIRGLAYCQHLLSKNMSAMLRSTPHFAAKINNSLKLAVAVLSTTTRQGMGLIPRSERHGTIADRAAGISDALDDVISEVVWEMVQDAAVRALLCITVVDLDQTVVQSEVHHFLRDYRLLPTALRDVESVLDKAIEAFLESGRDASILLDGYEGGGPGVRGLRIGRVYTIIDVLWSGTRSVIFKCRQEEASDRASSGGGGQRPHNTCRRGSEKSPIQMAMPSGRGSEQDKRLLDAKSLLSSASHINSHTVVDDCCRLRDDSYSRLVAVKLFYRPQTDGETSMIMNECAVHKYLSEKLIARDSRGGKVETGDAPAPSPPPPPPPFPRWIHCGSTGSGLRYSVMDMFEGITLEQELQDIIEGRRPPYTLGEAQSIMKALLAAVEAAHEVGVVHRNINPSSIVVMEYHEASVYGETSTDEESEHSHHHYHRLVALMDWAAATIEATPTTEHSGKSPREDEKTKGLPESKADDSQEEGRGGPIPDWSSLLKVVGWVAPEQIQRWAQQSSFGIVTVGAVASGHALPTEPSSDPPATANNDKSLAHSRAQSTTEMAMDVYSCAVVLSQCYGAVRYAQCKADADITYYQPNLRATPLPQLAHCASPVTLEDQGLLRVKQLVEAHVQSLDQAQDQLARGVYGLEVVRSPMRAGGDIYRRLVVAIDKYRETPASDLQSQKRDICFGYPQVTSVLRQSLRPRSSDRPAGSCRGLKRLLSIAFDRDVLRIVETSARLNRRVVRDGPPLVLPWSIIADELGVGPLSEGYIRRLLKECSTQKKLILFGQAAWAGCSRLCRIFMEAGVNPFENPAEECTATGASEQHSEMSSAVAVDDEADGTSSGSAICTGSLTPVQLAIMAGRLSCVHLMASHARRLGRIHVPHLRRDLLSKSATPMLASTMPTIVTEGSIKRASPPTPPSRAACPAPERSSPGPSRGPLKCIDMILPHNKGGTALHWATTQCPTHLIKPCCSILYNTGHASANITNHEGLTPLDTAGCIADKQSREVVWRFFLEIGCRTGHGSRFMWLSLQDRIDMTILALLLASIAFVSVGFITNHSNVPPDEAVKWMFGCALTVLILVPFMCMVHRLSRAGAVGLWWFRLTHRHSRASTDCGDCHEEEPPTEGDECSGPAKRCAHGVL